MNTVDNTQDIIDSRDVIERIEELESICLPVLNLETGEEELDPSYDDEDRAEALAELEVLQALADEAEPYGPDWEHGEVLIRDSYFEEYARELAQDIGAVSDVIGWPHDCIDWQEAAEQLRMDYTAVDFDGVTYWIR